MNSVEIIGFGASIMIGISLGLIGGGGSILTLPVMVYLLHISPVISTAYSLFVVGTTSLVGSFSFMRKGLVNYQAALVFAIPSFTTVFLTRRFLVPAIPDPFLSLPGFEVSKNVGIMVFFALIMLAASYSMIKSNKEKKENPNAELKFNYLMIALEGGLVGVLTGIVGAGGGFLIIPALVLFARLPMKMAVGTSLLIIAAKSLIGFLGDLSNLSVDWAFLLPFTALSILGIFAGSYISKFIPGEKLKKAFGWFVLVMGIYIITKEVFFHAV
ncbi:sulfite exporter TauE/SafE family protein [Lacihabitans sp. CS3-21]|uniref:sulfite exporter TauE/SafE family protein n=1 Tax=Lacihabitans sp. CS3-21 TaxID=2487332 RepID=UPI0020CBD194|nr:sulfite exporter TauE/SafE family protein [Lacihabitans sp. CS3-21]MCP9748860.1 sulfite exporter TauE/SafE family protein [Lacihabitans sp. CS3-21]